MKENTKKKYIFIPVNNFLQNLITKLILHGYPLITKLHTKAIMLVDQHGHASRAQALIKRRIGYIKTYKTPVPPPPFSLISQALVKIFTEIETSKSDKKNIC